MFKTRVFVRHTDGEDWYILEVTTEGSLESVYSSCLKGKLVSQQGNQGAL